MSAPSRTRPVVATPTLREFLAETAAMADPRRAKVSAGFFKTGEGEYGAGDRFLGIPVPVQRKLAVRYAMLPLEDVAKLLADPVHEHRLTAAFILVRRFERAKGEERDRIATFYWDHRAGINNWDMVDTSTPQILGEWLLDRDRSRLDRLARSRSLWERRMAMLATQTFIRNGEFDDTIRLAERLIADPEDLMHKAVGWMLREVGDRDPARLRGFLTRHAGRMPRTMLRYAIEKMPATERKKWLAVERVK